ncbi:Hypothetical protein NTJ_12145 [Nesidiocoris tenuis]|uniref:Secreted protein n=2 Tax=Nesidiocoris tenuis TaxID=355587 RepID=A0ABN7B4J1_9HEMI|nr:Hypothetical protein NTJ_12145 [Nesidiocoris tenuis]
MCARFEIVGLWFSTSMILWSMAGIEYNKNKSESRTAGIGRAESSGKEDVRERGHTSASESEREGAREREGAPGLFWMPSAPQSEGGLPNARRRDGESRSDKVRRSDRGAGPFHKT